ncbi:MAG: MarR family transcriptional regulator [Thermoleophilia bacterium]|nr:MarR family transcriptional regulator [Thermoleophilia bacterium]
MNMTTNASTSRTALETVTLLARVRAELVREVDRSASGHGVSFSDLTLLRELAAMPDGRIRRVDLAERLGVTTSAIARQLGPLERIGLVDRESNPKDARLAIVVLTDAGRRTAAEASVFVEERATALLDRIWSPREQAQLDALLAKAR